MTMIHEMIHEMIQEFTKSNLGYLRPADQRNGWLIGHPKISQKKCPKRKVSKEVTQKVLELIRDNLFIKTQEMATIIGVDRRTITGATTLLQAKGIIRRVDGRKEGYWQVLI